MPGDAEVTQRAGSLRSLTGLTEAEFQALLLSFEQAFVTYSCVRLKPSILACSM
jgi:hypothetical protein